MFICRGEAGALTVHAICLCYKLLNAGDYHLIMAKHAAAMSYYFDDDGASSLFT